MSSRFLSGVIPLLSLFISRVRAQSEMAQCLAGWEWNQNSFDQDPCTVGSLMDASCRGLVLYTYPPLDSTQYYVSPRANDASDLSCDCNTVMYNLYMACASCQGAVTYPWTTWMVACDTVYVSQYPSDIPQNTSVPYWAYFNVTSTPDQMYDDATAMNIGQNPEGMPPLLTITSSINTRTSTSGHAEPTSSSSDTNGSSGGTNVGAIVGGVVGSVIPLTIFAVGVFFYLQYRRQQQAQQQAQNLNGLASYEQHTPSMYGPPMPSVPPNSYNPYDPKTFPPQSSQNPGTYATPSHNVRGSYYGIPEV